MPLRCFRKNPRGFLGATASQQNPLYIPNQVAWSHEHTGAHKAVVDAAEVVLEMLGRWRRGLRGKLRDSGDEGISIPSSLNNYSTVKPQRERLMISDRTFCTVGRIEGNKVRVTTVTARSVGYSKSEAGCGADKIDAVPVEFVQPVQFRCAISGQRLDHPRWLQWRLKTLIQAGFTKPSSAKVFIPSILYLKYLHLIYRPFITSGPAGLRWPSIQL